MCWSWGNGCGHCGGCGGCGNNGWGWNSCGNNGRNSYRRGFNDGYATQTIDGYDAGRDSQSGCGCGNNGNYGCKTREAIQFCDEDELREKARR